MTKTTFLGVLLAIFATATIFATEPIEILSINVRLSTAKDGDDAWPLRKESLLDVLKQRRYDFIGGQEVVVHPDDALNQFKYLSENLPEYGSIFCCREKDPGRGEGAPVFYRKDRWEPDADEQGTFWLSDTPDVPGSVTWKGQSACPRVVSWGLFHEIGKDGKRTGAALYVYCSHFDHVGEIPRQKAADMVLNRIAERKQPQAAIVFMGDLNCGERSPSIRFLKGETVTLDEKECRPPLALIDSYRVVHPDEKNVVTFNSFKEIPENGSKIDYIFVSDKLKTVDAEIDRSKNKQGRFPTDHFPIRATVELIP